MSDPKNAASYLPEAEAQFKVDDAPYTHAGPGEVVIKNAALAVNPMDWKIQTLGTRIPFPKKYPAVIGNDIAGEIYEVGDGVTTFQKGDRVISKPNWFANAGTIPSTGGFQLYTVCLASTTAHLPAKFSFAEGCVLPLAICTAAMGIYPTYRLGLPLPSATSPQPSNKVILVWGGSSSTGSAAIQLAVASGVKVVATASAHNHDLVKSLGAESVWDYRKESITTDLVKAIKDSGAQFSGAVDAISEEPTVRACGEVVKGLGGGRLATFLPTASKEWVPDGVELLPVNDTSAISKNKEIVEAVWGQYVPEALANGNLKAIPEPLVVGKGLEYVGEGVALLKKGISAKKVVIELGP